MAAKPVRGFLFHICVVVYLSKFSVKGYYKYFNISLLETNNYLQFFTFEELLSILLYSSLVFYLPLPDEPVSP